MRRCLTLLTLALTFAALCLLPVSEAVAQRGRRGDDDDRGRRERGRDDDDDNDDRGRRGPDPKEMIARFDENKDGVVAPDEVSGRYRRYYERMVEQAGMSAAGPVRVQDFIARIERKERAEQREEQSEEFRAGFLPADGAPLTPGFGVAVDETVPLSVPGFGPPAGDQLPLDQLYTERLIREVDEIFERYDRNGDGRLDAAEQREVRWGSDPKESDLNSDGILDKREMCERMAQRWGDRGRIDPDDDDNDDDGDDGKSRGSSGSNSSSDQIPSYVTSMLKRYDENGNGVFEKEEWSKMSNIPAEADASGDGVLTRNELAAWLNEYSRGGDQRDGGRDRGERDGRRNYYGSRRGDDDGDDDSHGAGDDEQRDSYRFLSPTERLPEGLPSWFAGNDVDGDGQVSMHEFSSAWTKDKAEEFSQLDHNGDGRITPEEALAGE